MADKLALAENWRERIQAQQAGGLSIRAWCREHGVADHLFYWWRRRLNLSPVRSHRKKRAAKVMHGPLGFAQVMARVEPGVGLGVQLPMSVSTSNATAIRLRLGGSRELLLPVTMEIDQVAKLIRAIEGIA